MNTKLVFPLKKASALLFLNGVKTPLTDSHLTQIASYSSVIAVDGAWNNLSNTTLSEWVTLVIGDGDSLQEVTNKYWLRHDQNKTDFEKALQCLIENGETSVDVFWGSGGEMDHFLGNLSVAAKYAEKITCRFFDEHQVYAYIDKDCLIKGAKGCKISVYPFPKALLSSQGLAYEMERLLMHPTQSQSLRNQIVSDYAELFIHGSAFIFIERLPID